MDEPPKLMPAGSEATAAPMSLWARLLNVFAVPGDVFEDVKRTPPSAGSWLLPTLLACVVGVGSAVILFSQPAIVQKVRNQQQTMRDRKVEEFNKKVEEGKMKRAQADQAIKGMDMMLEMSGKPMFLKISASVGAVIGAVFRVFWWGFVLWLLSLLILRSRISYLKGLEVVGLSTMIGTLGVVVTLLLQVNLGNPTATPSFALAISEFDPSNKMHLVLGALNLVQIWMVIVMAIGLSRLANVPFARASLLVLGFWLVQQSALILIGAGMGAL